MKKSTAVVSVAVIVVLSWALPLYGVIYNYFYPSYESALGVAYGFMIGGAIHLLAIVIWFMVRRAAIQSVELMMLLFSVSLLILLAVIGDIGALSTVTL